MMNQNISESIFQKRMRRFKSIKRGYYSLILVLALYVISIFGPIWMNNKPLLIRYGNMTWDTNETYEDANNNGSYDIGESFNDKYHYFFPAIWDLLDFIPGINYPVYESDKFGQFTNSIEVDFRLLDKLFEKQKWLVCNKFRNR